MKWLRRLLMSIFLLYFPFANGKIEYNTVTTPLSRATPHVPKVVKRMCLLIPDEGPCRADIDMYYFMPETMNCSTFRWGGCQGNGNRFDTREECLSTCLTQPGVRLPRPAFCTLKFDYGFCFGDDERWYYDRQWNVCRKTIYSGCGGNNNNFYSLEGCEDICRFGHGRPKEETKAHDKNELLIVNPSDATSPRSRNQTTTSSNHTSSSNSTSSTNPNDGRDGH